MVCTHLQELYQLCHQHQLRLGSSELIRIVCHQCGQEDVCPSVLTDEYESKHPEEAEQPATEPTADE